MTVLRRPWWPIQSPVFHEQRHTRHDDDAAFRSFAFSYPVVMLFIRSLASCWCLAVTTRLGVGVDVATSGSASEARETWVRMGGILRRWVFALLSNECLSFGPVQSDLRPSRAKVLVPIYVHICVSWEGSAALARSDGSLGRRNAFHDRKKPLRENDMFIFLPSFS
jgi:hypothetical protein